ncbi:MAG: flavin reductase family protein [Oscillospiraceae bacterium]|nr:flavin reductase family protein [Oscillospiraceae bacterium]
MVKITLNEALEKTSPTPVALVCSTTPEGKTNIATVAWWTYLENEPPMMGFSMWKGSYSSELIKSTGKVAVSLPGESLADEAMQCGIVSGREVDKVEKHGIELVDAAVKFPIHSRVSFVCTVDKMIDIESCIFFVCKIDEIYYNEKQRHIYTIPGAPKLMPFPT